jgi:hypothetical protein
MYRKCLTFLPLVLLIALPAQAASRVSAPLAGIAWLDQLLSWPMSLLFQPKTPASLEMESYIPPVAAVPCLVAPLPEVTDVEALEFEAHRGSDGVVQTDGLTPAAAMALSQFESLVAAYGGTLTLTSAYRPPAYQEHLQAVWDKWMVELRHNEQPECQGLRAQVWEEFAGHQLLETQRPAGTSDHSLGTAFDAAVFLPLRPRRKAVSIDRLAWRAGLYRPVAIADPVHFRLGVPKRVAKKSSRTRV